MDARAVGPCEPEKTDGKCAGSYHGHGQTSFRGSKSAAGGCDSLVSFVVPEAVDDGDEHAYRDTKECKTANAWRPSALLLIDDGKCSEEQVKCSVDDCPANGEHIRYRSSEKRLEGLHVNAEKKNDRLPEQQLPRSDECGAKDF